MYSLIQPNLKNSPKKMCKFAGRFRRKNAPNYQYKLLCIFMFFFIFWLYHWLESKHYTVRNLMLKILLADYRRKLRQFLVISELIEISRKSLLPDFRNYAKFWWFRNFRGTSGCTHEYENNQWKIEIFSINILFLTFCFLE